MADLEEKNSMRSMMKSNYGEVKTDKSNELNESMTISEQSRDEYESTLHNLGGTNNA